MNPLFDQPNPGSVIARIREWFLPDHRKEAATAAIVMALLLTASAPTALLRSPANSLQDPAQMFAGPGVWADWTELDGEVPAFSNEDLDRAADQGISTFYVQVARQSGGDPIYQRDRVEGLIRHARERSMIVIGWYLPQLDGKGRDVEVARAALSLGIDGYALDIEHREGTASQRNAELDQLEGDLRDLLPNRFPLGAVVIPPVLIEHVNPKWWGGTYPYAEIVRDFDAVLVMSYATDRLAPWDDSYVHMTTDITYLRSLRSDVQLHMIAGYGTRFDAEEAEKAARAAAEWCAIGVSIYAGAEVTGEMWAMVHENFSVGGLGCRPKSCVDVGVTTLTGAVFSPGGYALLPVADPQLVAILAEATANTDPIVLHGHSDSTGSADKNLELSQSRAESVKQWLTSRGVAEDRISVRAWGEECPIRSNSTQLGRETNRRVDVQLHA